MDVCQIFLKLFTQFSTGQVINFLYKRKILCGIFLSKRIPSGTLYNIKVIFLSRSLMLLCGSSIKHHINPLEISFTRGKREDGKYEDFLALLIESNFTFFTSRILGRYWKNCITFTLGTNTKL